MRLEEKEAQERPPPEKEGGIDEAKVKPPSISGRRCGNTMPTEGGSNFFFFNALVSANPFTYPYRIFVCVCV